MKAKLLSVVALALLVSACMEPREVVIPSKTPAITTDTISRGSLMVNEVASRWTTAITSEYVDFMLRRRISGGYTVADPDYLNGVVKWFEVYNNSKDTIDFSKGGWYFTDAVGTDSSNTKQPIFSILKLAPKSMAAVYADTAINNPNQAQLHIGFGIAKTGGTLGIFYKASSNSKLLLVDTLSYPAGVNGKTWSRIPDGNSAVGQAVPTPNAVNKY